MPCGKIRSSTRRKTHSTCAGAGKPDLPLEYAAVPGCRRESFAPECAAQAAAATAVAQDNGATGDVFGKCCSDPSAEAFSHLSSRNAPGRHPSGTNRLKSGNEQ